MKEWSWPPDAQRRGAGVRAARCSCSEFPKERILSSSLRGLRVPGLRAAGEEHRSTSRDRRQAQVTFPAGAPLSEVAVTTPPSGNATDLGHQ